MSGTLFGGCFHFPALFSSSKLRFEALPIDAVSSSIIMHVTARNYSPPAPMLCRAFCLEQRLQFMYALQLMCQIKLPASGVVWYGGLSAPGVNPDCNFAAHKSHEIPDAPLQFPFLTLFCRIPLIAARGGPPLLPPCYATAGSL